MAKNFATKSSSPTTVISANALMQFGSEQFHQVVDNCGLLFSQEDVLKHVDIWRQLHAKIILNIISSIFMESDDDDDDVDANLSGYHNEWDDFLKNDSFFKFNQSAVIWNYAHSQNCQLLK